MQQNPETGTIANKKAAERRIIEAIVGRKPDPGEAVPENIRRVPEHRNSPEVQARSTSVYVVCPWCAHCWWVDIDYEGEWFIDDVCGHAVQVWY